MFFKKKKSAEVVIKNELNNEHKLKPVEEVIGEKELLYKENIKINCKSDTQENVIRAIGQMLVDTGYVETPYIEAMIEREKSFSTYMGSDLALPHGVEAAKKEVIASGIAIMVFPEGVEWGDATAKIVIGIAGVGEEHLTILGIIAEKMMDEDAAEKLVQGDVDTIYNILTGKE
ncbi:MAG: PTS sugar transporter subunit IIA [Eubacteriales bacterium]